MSDPRLTLTADGADLTFYGGQPVMDDGLENLVLISLFTGRGWCGNSVLGTAIGSDFEAECNKPITLRQLNAIRHAAELALTGPLLGKVVVTVTNPVSHRLNINIFIQRYGVSLDLLRDGGNWYWQQVDPAHRRDRGQVRVQSGLVTLGGEDVTFGGGTVIW